MFHNRRACVSHHKHLDLFHNFKKLTLISNDITNNKQFHATRIHQYWNIRKKKHIYSNRLGISYDVSYLANGYKFLHFLKDRRMYRKRLDNFRLHHSGSSTRSKKQKARFQRACRSVFYNRGNNQKSHRRVDNLVDKLHLLRDEQYYAFPIPPDLNSAKAAAVALANLDPPLRLCPGNNLTTDTNSSTNTSQPILSKDENTWHDKLGIWIQNDLFPYVSDEPVYISKRQATLKGRQHAPGSTEWLTVIRKRKKAHESAERQEKECLLREEDLSARAKLWGTSSNSIEYREEMTKDLTKFQEHYHKKITPLIERRAVLENRIKQGKNVYKTNKQLFQLEQELGVFKIDYFSVMDDNAYHYRYKGHTSDDTKKLELRPHKRPPIPHTNTDRAVTYIKKARLDTLSPEDFKVFTPT
ncbi:unnamed protein product [Rhizophagus irregularis]|nr:unnamed protein product [Rhizophagus irregularis]